MLTFEQAKELKPGDILLDIHNARWRVSGKVRLWKTMPNRIYVPLKHGLYNYSYIDEASFHGPDRVCNILSKEKR